jgi:hypothetical protein
MQAILPAFSLPYTHVARTGIIGFHHKLPRGQPFRARESSSMEFSSRQVTRIPKLGSVKTSIRLLVTIIVAVISFPLVESTQAVTPPPDGGYPNANTAEGQSALFSLTTGVHNTALGFSSLFRNTTGNVNTASGSQALLNNTTGNRNTATGFSALLGNTIGSQNTATGCLALTSNTTGTSNTANGAFALSSNTNGVFNTANGVGALASNTTGGSNTAIGVDALSDNTTGIFNTAIGVGAMSGGLYGPVTGRSNTAVGFNAMLAASSGDGNVAIGEAALYLGVSDNNTAVGNGALESNGGSNNIALGNGAGQNHGGGDNSIYIGNQGVEADSNTIRIGDPAMQTATYIAGISGAVVPAGVAVIVGSDGRLGTMVSSARFKDDIKPMDKASEPILALKPVTFHYKKELDPKGTVQFGLVAEQVEKIDPDLVSCAL